MDNRQGSDTPAQNTGFEGGSAPEIHTSAEKKTSGASEAYDWIQCLVSALLICVLVFAFFVRIIGIKGSSMVPTFHNADSVIISNLFYQPKYGDVVVLRKQTFQKEPIIKRVIATGGQTVNLVDGVVYVDGVALDEPYTLGKASYPLDYSLTGVTMSYPYTVPEGSVWVMGDNRTNSLDSRYFGAVSVDDITSRAVFIFWPFSDAQTL